MQNKYKQGELVKINGKGKIFGKVKEKLGFIIDKDEYFGDYYVKLVFGSEDWYRESDITRVFEKEKINRNRYQVRVCTTTNGYILLKEAMEDIDEGPNGKFKQIKVYKTFVVKGKEYIILGWNSIFWYKKNKNVKLIEETINSFRELNIPFQYIVMNEKDALDIREDKFTRIDNNVNVLYIENKIKIKKLGKEKG